MFKNLNLGIAQTVSKELKTYRALSKRIEVYEKYAKFHKIRINHKVNRLLNGLKKIQSKLSSTPCYLLPTYSNLRKVTNRILKLDKEDLWTKSTGLPFVACPKLKMDRTLQIRLKGLSDFKDQARNKEKTWRVKHAILEGIHKKHYLIFNTLTVEPSHYSRIWDKESRVFSKYIKTISDLCQSTHEYFMVREAGTSNGRLHVHCLHILGNIPDVWKVDPNDRCILPLNREIDPMKKLWPYGLSQPIAVRINANDSYSALNWRWPLESPGVAVEPTNPSKLANYLSKYMTKEKEKTKWKTRMNHGFGLNGIRKAMQELEDNHLEYLATLNNSHLLEIAQKRVPKQIMIKEAIREIMKRESKKNSFPMKMKGMIPEPSIIKQWKSLTQTKKLPNLLSTPFTVTRSSKEMDYFNPNYLLTKIEKGVKCVYDPLEIGYARHFTNPHKNGSNL